MRLHGQVETLSHRYPRLGYHKLVRLLRQEGWQVGRKLVQRIRRECGLRVRRWTTRDMLAGYVAGLAGRNVWAEQVAGRGEYSDAFLRGYTQGCAHRITRTASAPAGLVLACGGVAS